MYLQKYFCVPIRICQGESVAEIQILVQENVHVKLSTVIRTAFCSLFDELCHNTANVIKQQTAQFEDSAIYFSKEHRE